MLCANIDYDEHKGRIAIGRVTSGTIKRGQTVAICRWVGAARLEGDGPWGLGFNGRAGGRWG